MAPASVPGAHAQQPERHHGGAALRALRQTTGRTQLWVEAEAGLGTGYLQRVEAGKVAQPTRETVERILEALAARYSERRLVLEQYGYAVQIPRPDDADWAWAREEVAADLAATPFPAYVLDCAHRLVVWNDHVRRLFEVVPTDPTLGRLAGRSMVRAWFDPASSLPGRVVAPERFFPSLMRAFHYEMSQFGSEPWYDDVLDELLALPLFRRYWDAARDQPPPAIARRALVPIELRGPGPEPLSFRLISEPLMRDQRFRTIGYIPADTATMRWCAEDTGGDS